MREKYIKIHFAVDVRTKEVLAIDGAMDDMHDSEVLLSLIMDAQGIGLSLRHVWMEHMIQKVLTSILLGSMDVNQIIKSRRSVRTDPSLLRDVSQPLCSKHLKREVK
jgi:hypothetical protein